MVGDSQIGKTSLMVKYVEGNFNEDYIQTLGKEEGERGGEGEGEENRAHVHERMKILQGLCSYK